MDRSDELSGERVLQQETGGAGLQGSVSVLVEIEDRNDKHPGAAPGGHDAARRLDAIESRHLNIHHHDIRPQVRHHSNRLGTVRGLAGNGHARIAFEEQSKAEAL